MFWKKGRFEFLLVGLGNPGRQYDGTRHNAGFACADFVAKKCGADGGFKKKFNSLYCEIELGGVRGILQKPQGFMNRSGLSVRDLAAYYKIPYGRVIVMHDDITLAPGRFKVKTGGSDGGHNGVKNIIDELRFWDFCHIKLGIGPKTVKEQPLADFVLGGMPAAEAAAMQARFEEVFDAVSLIAAGDIEGAKAKYNREKPETGGGDGK